MSVNGYNGVFSTGGGVNGGSVGHGNGGGPPGRPRSRNAVPVIRSRGVITKDICCYGCGEVVTANVTITSCQCTFCDDCMQQFMGTNDHCPSCGTKTESTDFSEVCVTNYADGVETIDKDDSVMDAIMAFSAKEGSLTHQQMARNLFREFEKHDRRSSFVIRQLSNQAMHMTSTSNNAAQRANDLEQKLLQMKTNTNKIKDHYMKQMAVLKAEVVKKNRQIEEFSRRAGHVSAASVTTGGHRPSDGSFMGSPHHQDPLNDTFSHNNGPSPSYSTLSQSRESEYCAFLRRKKQEEQAQTAAILGGRRPLVGGGTGSGSTSMRSAIRSGTPLPSNRYHLSSRGSLPVPVSRSDQQRASTYPRHNVPLGFAPRQQINNHPLF